jgi:CHAT domain-containing protein
LRTYGLIDAANALVDLQNMAVQDIALTWLREALGEAQTLADLRAESYALGTLGQLYRNAEQLEDAKTLTRKALELANQAQAPEVSYLWNAQLGDLQRTTGETESAIANYSAAVNTLETLRRDLVAIDDDARYNFRETVEPVYRNLVDLLTTPANANQGNLQNARAVIEALQLAELENFFREACLPVSEDIDQVVDNTAQPTAVLYPIILPDRLEVVLKLPQQPLIHFSAPVSQTELEAKLQQFRRDVVLPYTLRQVQTEAQALYRWLVEPALPQLNESSINTLVFVLDGALRNIPMGLLYSGERYLIEDFGVAVAPGLQLVAPKALTEESLSVFIAGISELRAPFPPLPYVAEEVKEVEAALSSRVLLNRTFTVDRLEAMIKDSPFPVVHLATHGQFSSNPEETFILAWDDRIPIDQFNRILRNSEQSRQSAIELLVLSACQTATGDNRAALGLAGVAVRAGARSTVASLWSLDDETTALAMNRFYRALKTPGISRAEALRQAQLALLANPRYEHPRHWAPYILIGNWL